MKNINPKNFSLPKIIKRTYINIRETTIKLPLLLLFAYLFEASYLVPTLDIIFNKHRTDTNLYFPLYFISPIFLMELFLSKFGENCEIIKREQYTKDQISLILTDKLSMTIYTYQCKSEVLIYTLFALLVLLFISFTILSTIQTTKTGIKILHKIASIFIYTNLKVIFPSILYILLKIISNTFLIPAEIKINAILIISVLLLLFYISLSLIFRQYFESCYYTNQFWKICSNNLGNRIEFILIIISNWILSWRLNFNHNVFFKVIYVIVIESHFYFWFWKYWLHLYRTPYEKGVFKLHLFLQCLILTKLIFMFLINNTNFTWTFQIFEIVIILFLFLTIDQIISQHYVKYPLNQLLSPIWIKGNTMTFQYKIRGLKEWYAPLICFFESHDFKAKSTDIHKFKDKNELVWYYKSLLIKHFIFNHDDLSLCYEGKQRRNKSTPFTSKQKEIIVEENENDQWNPDKQIRFQIQYFLYSNPRKVSSLEAEDFKFLLEILLTILNKANNNVIKKSEFVSAKEIIKIIKIIWFYTYDERTFRVLYFLKSITSTISLSMSSQFYLLSNYWFNLFYNMSKNEEHYLIEVILQTEKDYEYLKIIKSFKSILQSNKIGHQEKLKTIDIHSEIIGNSYNWISKSNFRNSEKVQKTLEQYEMEKYKVINTLLFSDIKSKSLDCFDWGLLENGPSQNAYFIWWFENNTLIIKKVPYKYIVMTSEKSSPIIGKSFPSLLHQSTREDLIKEVKNNIIQHSKNIFFLSCLFNTNTGFIVSCILKFHLLPLLSRSLYIIATIEPHSISHNCVLLNGNDVTKSTGKFLKITFGFDNKRNNELNVLKLWNVKDFITKYNDFKSKKSSLKDIATSNNGLTSVLNDKTILFEAEHAEINKKHRHHYKKKYTITLKKLMSNISLNLKCEESFSGLTQNIEQHLNNIKVNLNKYKLFKPEDKLHYSITWTNTFNFNNEFLYLVNLEFDEIPSEKTPDVHCDENASLKSKNLSAIQTASGSSVISSISNSESTWNIQGRKIENKKITTNIISNVILIYDIILIWISIGFLIIVKYTSYSFINLHFILNNLRDLNSEYFYGHFFISNSIKLGGTKYIEDYENTLKENIKGYNITLNNYNKMNFGKIVENFFPIYNYFAENLTANYDEKWINTYLNYSVQLMQQDGNLKSENLVEMYNIPKNNFYTLSVSVPEYIEIPYILNIENILNVIPEQEYEQRLMLTEIINSFTITTLVANVTQSIEKNFEEKYSKFQIEVYVLFIMFLNWHWISFLLSVYCIWIYYIKMLNISKSIIAIKSKTKILLIEKLKQVKCWIKSEEKPSIVFNQWKESTKICKEPNTSVSEQTKNLNNNVIIDNKKQNTKCALTEYKFKAFRSVLNILFWLSGIILIFSSIAFPFWTIYFSNITTIKNQITYITNFQSNIISYYLMIRYFIYVNWPEMLISTDFLSRTAKNIYSNFTVFKTILNTNSHLSDWKVFFDKLDDQNSCDFALDNDEYKYVLLQICDYFPWLKTNIETKIAYFINKIRNVFTNFLASSRGEKQIAAAYYSELFMNCNSILMFCFMKLINYSKYEYLDKKFTDDINLIILFLIIIFVSMVITEICNFCIWVTKGTNHLTKTLNNFILLQKFFIISDSESNNWNAAKT